jgi:HaeII restriction endonuclease.
MDIDDAKAEIDTLINNARFRCFRPIRVAEILYHSRTEANVALENPESYRVESGRWRDTVSVRLTGKASSSSKSYQKDFSDLIDPASLSKLDALNRIENGLVESYIYHDSNKTSGDHSSQPGITSMNPASLTSRLRNTWN